MVGKVCSRCKGKTLLGVVHKLLKTKITQQSFALLPQVNFPANNLNGLNPGYLLKSFLLYEPPISHSTNSCLFLFLLIKKEYVSQLHTYSSVFSTKSNSKSSRLQLLQEYGLRKDKKKQEFVNYKIMIFGFGFWFP